MKTVFLILILITLIVAEEILKNENDSKELARRKKFRFPFHGLFGYGFGFHALAILYWIKVKIIVVTFIIGTAFVWGVRYFWSHKTCPEVVHEGAIIPFDHGPSWSPSHHDHIEYSAPHSDFYPDHDPYSAYSSYSDSPPPDMISATSHPHRRVWRSRRQADSTEEQISEVFFGFLGVNSNACRKRFLCELEFKSNNNPISSFAFRFLVKRIFSKYVRNLQDENVPQTFSDCGKVHSDCTVIEEDIEENEDEFDPNLLLDESSTTIVPELQQKDLVAERILLNRIR